MRDNHLRPLTGGIVLRSEAVLIANRAALSRQPAALAVARHLLEYIEAHLRASGSYLITAKMCIRDRPHPARLRGQLQRLP